MRKQTDISQQVKKYLDGELDARAMHELERRAQDDPFLMDAIAGFTDTPVDMDAGLSDLAGRLQQRVAKKEPRIIPWRTMSIAASVLLLLGIGVFWYTMRTPSTMMMKKVAVKEAVQQPRPAPQTSAGDTGTEKQTVLTIAKDKLAANNAKRKPEQPSTEADTQADEIAAAPPAMREAQPSGEAVAAVKPADTTPLNEMAVMAYTAKKKPADQSKVNPVTPVADSTFSVSDKSSVAKVVNSGYALREVRIKGTDTAKLGNTQNGFVSQSPSQYSANMSGYQVKQMQQNAAVSMIASRVGPSPVAGGAARGYFAKRPGNTGGIAPLNPVIAHGKMMKGMAKGFGEPVAYATVKLKGTTISTLTDAQGRFTLYSVPDSAILQVSAEGYTVREVRVTKRDLQVIAIKTPPVNTGDVVYTENDQASPATGWDDFEGYLQKNAISPDGKKGTVKLSFKVNADNSISDIKVIKSVSTQTDNAAIKLIKDGPAWYSPFDDKAQTVTIDIKFRVRGK